MSFCQSFDYLLEFYEFITFTETHLSKMMLSLLTEEKMQAQIEIIKTKTQLQTSSQPKRGALPLGITNFLDIYNRSKKSNRFKYENTSNTRIRVFIKEIFKT